MFDSWAFQIRYIQLALYTYIHTSFVIDSLHICTCYVHIWKELVVYILAGILRSIVDIVTVVVIP